MERQTQKLRIGALVRVSTEQQERTGESLRTQRTQIEEAAERLGGKVVEWYGGQEHATPGFEKKELDRLLADAERKRFDAVMVAHTDRWSRDNAKSQAGLDQLRAHGVRFLVGVEEYDLFDPSRAMYLGMSAVIGAYQARTQKLKSLQNRIHRSKRGIPTSGKMPFGRHWDKVHARWIVDEEKQAMMVDVARRYLAGERLADLAKEYGVNNANLHKTLMKRCGDTWEETFDAPDLNIKETVTHEIPALLDAKTIAAVRRRAAANKTYQHGQGKGKYLLSGYVYCGVCGHALSGQTNPSGALYYRHHNRDGSGKCTCDPKPWVRCDELELAVMDELFDQFRNPLAMQRAIEAATPNRERVDKIRERRKVVAKELAAVVSGRDRLLGFITKGTVTEEQAERELQKLHEREMRWRDEDDKLEAELVGVPDPAAITQLAADAADILDGYISAKKRANQDRAEQFEHMTTEDKLHLLRQVFNGETADGQPMGVYVLAVPGQAKHRRKEWRFMLRGKVVDKWYGVTQCASRSQAPNLP